MEVSNLSVSALKEIQTYNVNEATITSEYRMFEIRESDIESVGSTSMSRKVAFFTFKYVVKIIAFLCKKYKLIIINLFLYAY